MSPFQGFSFWGVYYCWGVARNPFIFDPFGVAKEGIDAQIRFDYL